MGMINIDGKALREQIVKKGMTLSQASRKIAKSDSYISTAVNNDKINIEALEQIKVMLKIAPEYYVNGNGHPFVKKHDDYYSAEYIRSILTRDDIYDLQKTGHFTDNNFFAKYCNGVVPITPYEAELLANKLGLDKYLIPLKYARYNDRPEEGAMLKDIVEEFKDSNGCAIAGNQDLLKDEGFFRAAKAIKMLADRGEDNKNYIEGLISDYYDEITQKLSTLEASINEIKSIISSDKRPKAIAPKNQQLTILTYFLDDPELDKAFKEFIEMRRLIGKPMSEKQIRGAIMRVETDLPDKRDSVIKDLKEAVKKEKWKF